jgi:hypothetical protein
MFSIGESRLVCSRCGSRQIDMVVVSGTGRPAAAWGGEQQPDSGDAGKSRPYAMLAQR